MNDPGKPLRDEKARMLSDQAARREAEQPKGQLAHARALLARLDQIKPNGPIAIRMDAPPARVTEDPPKGEDPEPLGGCFSDLLNDD